MVGIGRGDAGEVAKAAGGEFHHFGSRHFFEIVGGADDRIGDEMRQMAGDRQHQIVMLRPAWSRHWRRARARTPRAVRPAFGSVAFGRRQDAPAVDEQFGEAGIGTGILGAGDRMRRNEMHARRQMRRHRRDDRALTEPTSETMAPGFEMRRDLRATAPHAPTGTQTMTRSAPSTAAAALSRRPGRRCRARRPRRAHRPTRRSRRSFARSALACARARDRRADQADADQGERVRTKARCRAAPGGQPRAGSRTREILERRDDEAIGLLGADGHAQAFGSP